MEAGARNRQTVQVLTEAGRALGYEVAVEYPVPGGRIDVVWLTRLPFRREALPVVAFEVESSWRTRKHVKGDLLNLHDAGALWA
ncbi:MAG: hypothetical protein M3198_18675 [Actinomycetota bacterium]|nr:hypothetical protein [Actinomycetota bacterium]